MTYQPSVTLICLEQGCSFDERLSNMQVAYSEIDGHCKTTSGTHTNFRVTLGSSLETFLIQLDKERVSEIVGSTPNKEIDRPPIF